MRKSILFLTDLENGEQEDIITAHYLQKYFDVTTAYLDAIESIEDNFDLIIIRNVWPSNARNFKRYNKLKKAFLQRARKKKLRIYNDLDARGDRRGKNYLVTLYRQGYPVIPSVDSRQDFDKLPTSKHYLFKPKDGFSSLGIKTVKCATLERMQIQNQIVQPKLDFKYEISFYFIDQTFLYCLIFEPSKIPSWPRPKIFKLSESDLTFAREFVSWNTMKIGIQRIDAVRLLNGNLLLLEIEDDSPYFSITEISRALRAKFLKNFAQSVKNYLS